MRKVQSSAALLERQRNPGVGYWTSRPDSNADSRSNVSTPTSHSSHRPESPAPGGAAKEEEVNLEYLRNVILQFLEHKEMRVRNFSISCCCADSNATSLALSKCCPLFYISRRKRHVDL